MKCQILFSRKNKEKYFKMLSAETFYPACKVLKKGYSKCLMMRVRQGEAQKIRQYGKCPKISNT